MDSDGSEKGPGTEFSEHGKEKAGSINVGNMLLT
jgi:hypothetical protein